MTHFCRLLHQHQPLPDSMGDDQLPPQKPLSDSQKLRKVILELIDTERCYVKVSAENKKEQRESGKTVVWAPAW